ncbi:MAG: hypothetical protein KDD89_07875 [Anaerolineales bacterium]|nr:hypothetical protein [Anaerolineales bacterium]
MNLQTITLSLPETLLYRLRQTAVATKQPLEQVILRAVQLGSPPQWDDVPPVYQADLAALDRLDDDALWQVARYQQSAKEAARYQTLLDNLANLELTAEEEQELEALRVQADRQLLCKAHAVSLLRWRGYQLPPPAQL